MGRDELVPVTEFRAKITDMLDAVDDHNIVLVRHSRPAAIVMSPSRYEGLLDLIEDLEDNLAVARHQLNPSKGRPIEDVAADLGLSAGPQRRSSGPQE